MKLLDDYLRLQQELHDYFGYVENWKVIPIEDRREYLWYLTDDEPRNADVNFAKELEDFKTGNYYSNEIYTQRFLNRWVYRTLDYTMIVVDTHTDGNKFL